MAAGPTQKSLSVTAAGATPFSQNTAGAGAFSRLSEYDDYVTPAASDGAGTLYQVIRVRSDVIVKNVVIENEAEGAGKLDVGVYYASDVRDLAPGNAANAGAVISQNLFATDYDVAAAHAKVDITNQSGNYPIANRTQPLWQAAGLASDPGGKFDIVASVHTTDITTGTGKVQLTVKVRE